MSEHAFHFTKQMPASTFWWVILFCLTSFRVSTAAPGETRQSTTERITNITLDQTWFYHWGDFAASEEGGFWGIDAEANWTPYSEKALMTRNAQTFLWLKKTLPNVPGPNPAIFTPPFRMSQSFEVYLDHTLIYRAGKLNSAFTTRHLFILWHLIPLPPDCTGRILLFRFYSDHPNLIGLLGAIYLSERNTLFDQFILKDLGLMVFGLLFIIVGLLGYGVFLKIYRQQNLPVCAFATMATFSGVYLLADAQTSQLFLAQPDILFYGWNISFFLFMAGIYLFFEATIGSGRKRVYRLFWQFQAACLLLFILCDLLAVMRVDVYLFSIIGASLGILVGGFDTITQIRQGHREAKILGLSFGIFGVTGLVSMWSEWKVYPYGLSIVLAALVYLLILRYQAERRLAEDLLRESMLKMQVLQADACRTAHLAALGELSAGVAHEINNPVSGIIGCAEILTDECSEQGVSADIPNRILQDGKRIAKIVSKLLSFARQQPHELNPTRIADVLADVLMLTTKLFQKSGITVQLDIPQTLPMVMADAQQLQQVFINLLNNARYALDHAAPEKHAPKMLTITGQRIEHDGRQYVRTSFHDNGTGIPENILDKICDPFYTTKPIGEGTGLGLSISYGIIKDHDGRLSFESQAGELYERNG